MFAGGVLVVAAQRQMTRGLDLAAIFGGRVRLKLEPQSNKMHRCPEELILPLMKRMVDDLPVVRASTLVALGDIRRHARPRLSGSATTASNTRSASG